MSDKLNKWIDFKKSTLVEKQILKQEVLEEFIFSLKGLIFPGFSTEILDSETYFDIKLNTVRQDLTILLTDVSKISHNELDVKQCVTVFFEKLPEIDKMIAFDLDALYEGDPAAYSKSEIILCYPGLLAIFIYRVAHELALLNIPILPRVLSEYAHSKTGIDIHPNAQIGDHFLIDHGTGIVIGETSIIGSYVKIYQGVTLGALSLRDGHKLKGTKRHPTILDHVTIYSEASIFGGDTIIGPDVTIGSSAFITSSVGPDTKIVSGRKKQNI